MERAWRRPPDHHVRLPTRSWTVFVIRNREPEQTEFVVAEPVRRRTRWSLSDLIYVFEVFERTGFWTKWLVFPARFWLFC